MNILMLVKNSEIGGVVSCVKSLADGLKAKGDKTVIGTCQGEGVDKMLSGGGVQRSYHRFWNEKYSFCHT